MPAVSIEVRKSKWIRAERGGFLQFHVKPGEVVAKGDALATNTTLLGEHNGSLQSPFDAVVLGMTTLPAVSPGEPVCHLGQVPKSMTLSTVRRKISKHDTLEEQVSEELASSLMVVEPEES